jgi:BMFP domain-containing protein YqiC
MVEIRNLITRQENEAKDAITAATRKLRLSKLVDKLTALKLSLRFLEESHLRQLTVKEMTRQKREAFQMRLARLEQRQMLER